MNRKIIAVILSIISLLCILPLTAFAEENDIQNPEAPVILNRIEFRFASASHGMTAEQTKKLLSTDENRITAEWKKIFEVANGIDSNGKLYAGNEYEATVTVKADEGFAVNESTTVEIKNINISRADFSEEDGTITFVFRFTVNGNFYQKIITFFHNLFN